MKAQIFEKMLRSLSSASFQNSIFFKNPSEIATSSVDVRPFVLLLLSLAGEDIAVFTLSWVKIGFFHLVVARLDTSR
jgi:hypothetical protein